MSDKTNLSTIDVKNIIEGAFNGNLAAFKVSNGDIPYENENSENIAVIDGEETTEIDLAKYLDIHFFSWKNRVEEYDTWLASLNNVGVSTYAVVELTDSEVLPSPDIDSALLSGQITFLVPTNKVANLDYYVTKIRNAYAGTPFTITNRLAAKMKAFLNIGIALYNENPDMEQFGECAVVRVNFTLQYLNNALSYSDIEFEVSLDDTNYYSLAYTQLAWANTVATSAVPRINRPDITGFLAKAITQIKTLSFFDFDKTFTKELNKKFFLLGAVKTGTTIDALSKTTLQNVRIPIYLRVKYDGVYYCYNDVITDISKSVQNGGFATTTITLKGDAEG